MRYEPRDDVAAMLRRGATYGEIRAELGVSSHVIAATRKAHRIPTVRGTSGYRPTPEERADNERRTVAMLLAGATYRQVKAEVGISEPVVARIRREAGLPAPGNRLAGTGRTPAEALARHSEAYGDGHVRWTGSMAGRMPQLCSKGRKLNARRVAFEEHWGRPPVGYVIPSCSERECMAGGHLADAPMRHRRNSS
ncbi:hypothetical protein [Streptomyces sp. NPDC005732]|uniref:hypothetical protein n=1 Tax=Streptomyces sp. NPDC005732 TaxID=3157057 RepID=UPI0033DB4D4D